MSATRSATRDGQSVPLTPGRYRHFKGGDYILTAVARHTETDELLAVYRPAESDNVWVRPLSMFVEQVDLGDQPVPRFQRVA